MTATIGRRVFLVGFCGAAVTLSLRAGAQETSKLPRIGFLGTGTPSSHGPWVAAFERRLRELGWVEGRTVTTEYRWAERCVERFGEIAAEFAKRNVDVIVTTGGAVLPAKQAAPNVPIVFGLANDPVGAGMVASLERPGGNVTGLSIQAADTASKRVELLREVTPGLRTMAIMANVDYPAAVLEMEQARTAAGKLGIGTIADVMAEPGYFETPAGFSGPTLTEKVGARSFVCVPMLKENELIGAITFIDKRLGFLPIGRSTYLRILLLRPSSPSRTRGCSMNFANPSSSRRLPPTSLRSSRTRRQMQNQFSMRSPQMRCACLTGTPR